MTFEIFDHTGDVGIRYFGATIEELFSSAVEGTAALIGDPEENCTREKTHLEIQFTDTTDLMYQLLDRIINFFEVDEILLDSILRMSIHGDKAEMDLEGCKITEKFQYKYIMKAPTYHKMEISPEKGYGVQIFDI